jgi:DHA2 family multidrug resistance protein
MVSSTTSTADGSHADWQPSVNPWLVAASVMLSTFMVVLDSSVANVALPHIAGSLSASTDESTWVLTSYLVANAIMLPAAGWIARRIGRKRLLMISILVFTGASLLCGVAVDMPMLIVARVLQGLGGGGMQPLAQSILLESFPAYQTRYGDGRLRHGDCGGAGDWPHAGRLDYRQLFVALDLLHQSSRGLLALFMANLFIEDPPYLRHKFKGAIDFSASG